MKSTLARGFPTICLILLCLIGPGEATAIEAELVAQGLSRPIFVTAPAGDDRLFIIEQRGIIKILKEGQVLAEPFLDIDNLIPNITGNDERGLLGLAFHPDYANNRKFYVNYTNLSSDTIIARYLASETDPDVAVPSTAQILLEIDQPFNNHNGGSLHFGPNDGYLYIGMGDGGSAEDPGDRGQSDLTLLGKMLRIDVDGGVPYAIPPDNPFVDEAPLDEIWAKGLRNPYRWSFDRDTGDMYIGDVGQYVYEEVSFEAAGSEGGLNYGWRLMEGFHCFNPPTDCDDGSLTLPIYEYSHGGNPFRCSITGGYVYRGQAIPELVGTYFFADWCSNQIWSFVYDGGNLTEFTEWTNVLDPPAADTIKEIAGFGEDGFGELYIVERSDHVSGQVYKIVPDPADTGEIETAYPNGLQAAWPNPFRTSTQIELRLDRPSPVEVLIVDPAGRHVRTIDRNDAPAGRRIVTWDGKDEAGHPVAAGTYFVRAIAGESRWSRSVHLVR